LFRYEIAAWPASAGTAVFNASRTPPRRCESCLRDEGRQDAKP
jgi:hypothetical protein